MKDKLWTLLVQLLLLCLILAPFVFGYYLITDPINAIVLAISAYLWLIVIVIPGVLLLLIFWAVLKLVLGIVRSIFELLKSLFK